MDDGSKWTNPYTIHLFFFHSNSQKMSICSPPIWVRLPSTCPHCSLIQCPFYSNFYLLANCIWCILAELYSIKFNRSSEKKNANHIELHRKRFFSHPIKNYFSIVQLPIVFYKWFRRDFSMFYVMYGPLRSGILYSYHSTA